MPFYDVDYFRTFDQAKGNDNFKVITTLIKVSDSGTGTDTLPKVGILFSLSDSGHGSDSATAIIATAVSLSDSGQGTDAIPLQAFFLGDSGYGLDSSLTSYKVIIPDKGIGNDSLGSNSNPSTVTVKMTLPDAGTGLDSPFIKLILSISDSGNGTDVIPLLKAIIPTFDIGHGSDTSSLKVVIPLSESGVGKDISQFIKAILPFSDSGHGNDIVTIPKISFGLSDSGHGTDTLAFVKQAILITVLDSGKGTDSLKNFLTGIKVFIPNRHLILSIAERAKDTLVSPPIKLGTSVIPRPGRPFIQTVIKLLLNFNISLSGTPMSGATISFDNVKATTDSNGNALNVLFTYNSSVVTLIMTVTDASGNIVPGVNVTLNGVSKISNSNGQVSFTIYSSGVIQ
jgi:hypothetical protein